MQRLKALLPLLKNRFVLVGLVFLVWMVFFDSNDLISQYKYKRKLRQLEENKNFYLEQIELVKQDKEELFTNLKKLEKFAREKYKMKRDDEDLYIVLREKWKKRGALGHLFMVYRGRPFWTQHFAGL